VSPPSRSGTTVAEVRERLEAERGERPFLVYDDDGGRQRIAECAPSGTVVIGRDATSDVALSFDPEVSRVHAMLERIHNEWTVVDDGLSRNGTYVNERRVLNRTRLRDGDVVRVGRTRLRFHDPNPSSTTRTAVAKRDTKPSVTAAQRRVLVALCRPMLRGPLAVPASNDEVARELFLSVPTVRSHMRDLFRQLEIPDLPQHRKRAELACRALESGIVSEQELVS
jgi:pSer/pThr/pTyr-binding forkhead associated (FHA) protein